MSKFEYKKIKTILGENWHVVIDNDWLFYPCGEQLEQVQAFAEAFKEELITKRYSSENLGLAFYICGFNGDTQNRLRDYWSERGVHVF